MPKAEERFIKQNLPQNGMDYDIKEMSKYQINLNEHSAEINKEYFFYKIPKYQNKLINSDTNLETILIDTPSIQKKDLPTFERGNFQSTFSRLQEYSFESESKWEMSALPPSQNTYQVRTIEDLQAITYDKFITLDRVEFNLENGDLVNPKAEKASNDLIAESAITVGDSLLGIVSSEIKFRKLKKKAYKEFCALRERIEKAYEECVSEPYRGTLPVI